MSPRLKVPSLERFCECSHREKNNFLKGMVLGDLNTLKNHCGVDMDEFLVKIRREERLRKARAVRIWSQFSYSEIED